MALSFQKYIEFDALLDASVRDFTLFTGRNEVRTRSR